MTLQDVAAGILPVPRVRDGILPPG